MGSSRTCRLVSDPCHKKSHVRTLTDDSDHGFFTKISGFVSLFVPCLIFSYISTLFFTTLVQIRKSVMYTVTLIPGDGIGPSIAQAAVRVVEATGVKVEWERMEAGMIAAEKYKDPLPPQVIESIQRNKVALKGPLTTPVGKGFRSINVALRKEFDLYVNLRPAKSFEGVKTKWE